MDRRIRTPPPEREPSPPRRALAAGCASGVADATHSLSTNLSPWAEAARLPSDHRYAMGHACGAETPGYGHPYTPASSEIQLFQSWAPWDPVPQGSSFLATLG
jgi:hypothetical protein